LVEAMREVQATIHAVAMDEAVDLRDGSVSIWDDGLASLVSRGDSILAERDRLIEQADLVFK
jgi:hypothetical protein